MNRSYRGNFHSRSNSLDDESQAIPAWVWAFAIGVITLIVVVR